MIAESSQKLVKLEMMKVMIWHDELLCADLLPRNFLASYENEKLEHGFKNRKEEFLEISNDGNR